MKDFTITVNDMGETTSEGSGSGSNMMVWVVISAVLVVVGITAVFFFHKRGVF
jgi:hypothetical protein